MTLACGTVYEGEFMLGGREGKGVMKLLNPVNKMTTRAERLRYCIYNGEWKDDMMHGLG